LGIGGSFLSAAFFLQAFLLRGFLIPAAVITFILIALIVRAFAGMRLPVFSAATLVWLALLFLIHLLLFSTA
jgi:hypothetical protein